MTRLLVLGGTTEARTLCTGLAARGIAAEVSLAGRVTGSAPYPVPMRAGGFGGTAALARYLEQGRFGALIDATHLFAARMPAHAAEAARMAGLPRLMLKRLPWTPEPDERWQTCTDLEAAADALPAGAAAFLATGAGSLAAFARRTDCRLILRVMTAPENVPPHITLLRGRPGDRAAETVRLRELRVSHLVAKNSGGPARGKLDAARVLGLDVLMIAPPSLPSGPLVHDAAAALDWCEGLA